MEENQSETKKTSQRRREFLVKFNILRNRYPNVKMPEITDDMSDDQIELMYLKTVTAVKNEEENKPLGDLGDLMGQYMPTIMKLFSESEPERKTLFGSRPRSSSSSKPDLVVHHIIKFEH